MTMTSSSRKDQTWSSGFTFILAAVGAAVGLGNIWKFPYVVGVNGGGAFVLVYLACVVFVAIPILVAELWIGRRGHHSPPVAMGRVASTAGRNIAWSLVGWMGLCVGYLIVTYYSVIAGWTLAYVVKAAGGFDGAEPALVPQQFDALLADPTAMILWHTVFMVFALLIVGRGLKNGIERAVKFLMPALFVMMFVMIGYAAIAGDFGAAVDFLFSTDFSKIDGGTILTAIGQAFFSIGVAMGLMMAYGAYVPKDVSLTKSALIIAGVDTLVALLAGLMIFPLVFANGLDPASGPGLIFRTLPAAFAGMSGGAVFGALFFLLLAFAAITSIIAIIEPIVAYAEDKWGMRRRNGCMLFGFLAWAIGLATVFSFNAWAGFRPLGAIELFADMNIFALIDYFTANLLMPLGGILIAVFVGWRIEPALLAKELSFGSSGLFHVWLWIIRVIAPVAIFAVLYSSV
jgi:NSS family neurotransmitter:Na+ symporter